MNRRTLLKSAAVALSANSLRASEIEPTTKPFPGTKYQAYCRCLPDYLSRLSRDAVRKRESALSQLNSADSVGQRQTWVTETLWQTIGGKFEKTDLRARVTGELKEAGYRIEKLTYESRPGLFVTANLYFPVIQRPPFPAVLFQSGHYWAGKAHPSYQRCCQGLAQLGFAVLAFDPMGQGERINYLDETGTRSRLKEVDTEHTVPGMQYLLLGGSATQFQLWDAIRSLDFLLSRPEVDTARVASVGHSGGATLTMLLAATDSRLSAAAVCMGNIENIAAGPFLSPGATDDAEQNLIGAGPLGLDRWDLFYPFAPKPLLIWPSDRDLFATYSPNYLRNAWQEYQRLSRTYEILGRADRLGWADTPLPHALAYRDRLLVYNWFSCWLLGNRTRIEQEPPVKPADPVSLWATDSGSVIRSLHSATPFSLLRSVKAERGKAPLSMLLSMDLRGDVQAATVARVQTAHVRIEQLEVRSEPEVALPAFLLSAVKAPPTAPVLLVLDDVLAQRLWFEPEADDVIDEDCPVVVCAADIRGIGTLAPQFSPGAAEYEAWHQQEENYAWSSLFFGRPLVGQRARDILCLAKALRSLPATAGRSVHLAACGRLAFPALLAAALDPQIASLYLSGGLAAFHLVTEMEVPNQPLANYVPGWLKHTDIPELIASIAPRKAVWAGPVDAAGTTLDPKAARELYGDSVQNGTLTLRPSPEWSVGFLLSHLS